MSEKLFIPVEGRPGLVRDADSGSILNTNKDLLSAAKRKKIEQQRKDNEINNLRKEFDSFRDEVRSALKDIVGLLKG